MIDDLLTLSILYFYLEWSLEFSTNKLETLELSYLIISFD